MERKDRQRKGEQTEKHREREIEIGRNREGERNWKKERKRDAIERLSEIEG